ncbi:MAG TPA: type II toxin-antitoxin system Phd/YefM family antitoxin [Terriglobales bacterium]|nr:type II toxin-antitoxin system Phd/YefM family antitoxin [Terriglobales bacterium]
MKYVSDTDAKHDFASLLDAVQREPIGIRRKDQEIAVLLSTEEYERLRDSNAAEFQSFCDRIAARAAERGLTDAKFKSLLDER